MDLDPWPRRAPRPYGHVRLAMYACTATKRCVVHIRTFYLKLCRTLSRLYRISASMHALPRYGFYAYRRGNASAAPPSMTQTRGWSRPCSWLHIAGPSRGQPVEDCTLPRTEMTIWGWALLWEKPTKSKK